MIRDSILKPQKRRILSSSIWCNQIRWIVASHWLFIFWRYWNPWLRANISNPLSTRVVRKKYIPQKKNARLINVYKTNGKKYVIQIAYAQRKTFGERW